MALDFVTKKCLVARLLFKVTSTVSNLGQNAPLSKQLALKLFDMKMTKAKKKFSMLIIKHMIVPFSQFMRKQVSTIIMAILNSTKTLSSVVQTVQSAPGYVLFI